MRSLMIVLVVVAVAGLHFSPRANAGKQPADVVGRVEKSEAEWKKALTPAQYHVLRDKGTEIAFTGKY